MPRRKRPQNVKPSVTSLGCYADQSSDEVLPREGDATHVAERIEDSNNRSTQVKRWIW